jgi:hypothetical protein
MTVCALRTGGGGEADIAHHIKICTYEARGIYW